MRIGVLLLPTDPWPETIALAQRLERLGYDHLWVYDHLTWRRYQDRPWHAPYPWLAGLAANTSRIRLGPMVANLNVRHPLTLAKDAMTIDHISDGRFVLGVGAGGTCFDATALGQARLSPSERAERLAEAAGLIDGLLRESVRNHDGDFYVVNEARLSPGCVQRPRLPLAIAAGGTRTLEVAARFGDAWITWGDSSGRDLTPDGTERVVAAQLDRLEAECRSIGRIPESIDRIFLIGNTDARPLASIGAFQEFMATYEAIGFTDVVFHMPRADDPVWNEDPAIVEQIADRFLEPA